MTDPHRRSLRALDALNTVLAVIIADMTRGTGRFNVSQGAVATAQGLGAAFSASVAGTIIVPGGYSAAFLTLSAIAVVGFVFYWFFIPETRPSSD